MIPLYDVSDNKTGEIATAIDDIDVRMMVRHSIQWWMRQTLCEGRSETEPEEMAAMSSVTTLAAKELLHDWHGGHAILTCGDLRITITENNDDIDENNGDTDENE